MFQSALDRFRRRCRLRSGLVLPATAFPREYRTQVPPWLAARDAIRLGALVEQGRNGVDLWRPLPTLGDAHYRLRIYSTEQRALDAVMPLLQNLNLHVIDQVQYRLGWQERRLFLRSFTVAPRGEPPPDLVRTRKPVLEALDALLAGKLENDALNGLILSTGLSWKEVDVFRAYHNYYSQLGKRFSRFRFHQALFHNPGVTRLLFRYFATRFQPREPSESAAQREEILLTIRQDLAAALNEVTDTSEDHILRDLFNLIDATLRTNFYRRRDDPDYFISLKISGLGVIDMPAPRPLFEIYVHSVAMEGIHLRGAAVARGGIRWSDRPDDLRVEILDLMQTQMTKNALIVPQGAKGGFVIKTSCRDPEECERRAEEAYSTFIRGLLDVTDNRTETGVVHPPRVISYDDADPYLVVAADKGTAHLSDRANAIAREYGFWLGDAFASGGSHGFHHKRLGITARGAWECVRRHFLELGRDIENESITAVGIGSMDGDVFGNGMLWSKNILLLAAFSGQHIFLDPNPDPERSYRERRRLFELPNSTWADYDVRVISPGGGVFPRAAKEITLSAPVRAWLGLRHRAIDGEGLVRALLAAPVDLLWLGGIGTYVKAGAETHEEVGDRVNDAVRIDGSQVRATVVAEGANLGFTQKGRIEFALAGGHINTDAVDNSAGVDLSDHEVNLKILLGLLQEAGVVADEEHRNRLIEDWTTDVCESVLRDNRSQSLCLSLDRERCRRDPEPFLELADRLENAALLDRTCESFPSRKEVQARSGQGLVRPELAVLMAYAKLAWKRTLLEAGDFLDDEWAGQMLSEYFPVPVRQRYAPFLCKHPLAREIVATVVCNRIVDQAGSAFLVRIDELEPTTAAHLAGAYLCFDAALGGDAVREKVTGLVGRLDTSRQYGLLLEWEDTLAAFCDWAIREERGLRPNPTVVEGWRTDLGTYLDYREKSLRNDERSAFAERRAEMLGLGFSETEALLFALGPHLRDFPMMAGLARSVGAPLSRVAALTDGIAGLLGTSKCLTLLGGIRPRDRWERRAQAALAERFRAAAGHLARALWRDGYRDPTAFFAEPEMRRRRAKLSRLLEELDETPSLSLAPFAVLSAEVDAIIDRTE
ncbi:MAG TPA: NAD-glutamate dehydrogenase domain-containing protein [Methylococcus sp.]|nr:NAD-glutamate dehydrogenase domain-containing protein [Methylococcus sp.]